MRPEIALDEAAVQNNARVWRRIAGTQLYAVVKADGYGWGIARMVRALESVADAYCVADADELNELRRYTPKRAIVLSSVPTDRLAEVLHANAMPTLDSAVEFEIARQVLAASRAPLHVRIGLRPAASFSGLTLAELRDLAPQLAQTKARVELWTHVTDWEHRARHREDFARAQAVLRENGVTVAATDFASTFVLAAEGACGGAVRVGIGLFGATGGAPLEGVCCALRLQAPVVRLERPSAGTSVGYGGTMLRMGETLATARCGYADGLPKALAGADDILSVGMQYVTVRASRVSPDCGEVALLNAATDLDQFASRCGLLPHEIVTALGNRARADGVSLQN